MPTLGELTLQLSRDITANDHERARALQQLEAERLDALTVLPGAAAALTEHAEDIEEAERDQDKRLVQIEEKLSEGERQTVLRRDDALAEVAARFDAADRKAEESRNKADTDARKAFEAAVAKIDASAQSPGQKILARADARRVLDAALEAAHDVFLDQRLANKHTQQREHQAALDAELDASRTNKADAVARRAEAARAFAAAAALATKRLNAALAAIPGAKAVEEDVAQRRDAVIQTSKARESALFAAFREAKKALGLG